MTVVKLIPNVITQVKTKERSGYEAYQVGLLQKRKKLITRPIQGILKKAKTSLCVTKFAEVKSPNPIDTSLLGRELSYEEFKPNSHVDVSGISKGKGLQGVIKRYGFRGGPGSHGSRFHRSTGSIGNNAQPSKVFKNKKMPGHMGHKKVTVQNLAVIAINEKDGYLLLRGSIPGAKNSIVKIAKSIKGKSRTRQK